MKRNKLFLLAIASIFIIAGIFTSCNEDGPDGGDTPPIPSTVVDYGFYEGETPILKFEKTEHQLYLKRASSDRVFRMLNNGGTKYVEVSFSNATFEKGNVLSVTIKDSGFNVITSRTASFKIADIKNNTMWLIEENGGDNASIIVIYWE